MPRVVVLCLCWLAACYSANPAANVPCSGQDFACPKGQTCDFAQAPPTCVATLVDSGASGDGPGASGCTADSECPNACEEGTGTCVDANRILWVATTGDDTGTCTRTAPCASIARALELVEDTRDFIRVEDGEYRRELSIVKPVIISGTSAATAARITRGGLGPTIQVNAGGKLAIETVRIINGPGAGIVTYGNTVVRQTILDANTRGIDAQQGVLVVTRSLFTNQQDWAIRVNGASHTITSSVFADNARGVQVDSNLAMSSKITHCTFVNTTNDHAVRCQGIAPMNIPTVTNSIFANNQQSLDSRCSATYSLFSDQQVTGDGNLMGPPGFVSATDFHLAAGSAAIDAADPASTEPTDYDGVSRPRGARRDMGAFER